MKQPDHNSESSVGETVNVTPANAGSIQDMVIIHKTGHETILEGAIQFQKREEARSMMRTGLMTPFH